MRRRRLHAVPPAAGARRRARAASSHGLRAGPTPVVLADLYQSGQHYVEADGDRRPRELPRGRRVGEVRGRGAPSLTLVDARLRGERVEGGTGASRSRRSTPSPCPRGTSSTSPRTTRFRARVVSDLGRGAWAFPIDGRTLPLVTSRGCPFRCAHCSSNPGRDAGRAEDAAAPLDRAAARARWRRSSRVHGATRLEVLDELLNVNETPLRRVPRASTRARRRLRRAQRHARRLPRAAPLRRDARPRDHGQRERRERRAARRRPRSSASSSICRRSSAPRRARTPSERAARWCTS